MKTTCYYTIADFPFCITASQRTMDEMTSFEPFRSKISHSSNIFNANVEFTSTPTPLFQDGMVDEEICNGFGKIRMCRDESVYQFELSFGESSAFHTMTVDSAFSHANICLNNSDKYHNIALSSLLHILFSMAILPHGGIMTHASCVIQDCKGFMFLGKSGTGKSTHASLWLQSFPNTTLLNDDNPVIRLVGSDVYVYGTPWSGKTACYKNLSAPLRGIVRLEQAAFNQFVTLIESAAFACLLPSCSVIHSDERLSDTLYESVITVCEKIRIGHLKCLPDNEAAAMCRKNLMSN